MGSRRITIQDVAERAGVSLQTVSRVLNERPDVSPETRRRVQEVVEALGYRPSVAARNMKSKRTYTLGLITADFSDYFFMQVIIGAEAEARRQGYYFILGSTERNPADEPEYLQLLTERKVDGILFARPSTEQDDPHLLSLLTQGMPMVTTSCYLQGDRLTTVDVDNVDGGGRATRCLIEAGHRAIGMITGPRGWRSVNDRTAGYERALEEARIVPHHYWVEEGDWTFESGYHAMRRLLDNDADLSAVFVQNDQMAVGAIRALHEAGRKAPDDIAVVGYDDIPVAAYSYPALTTVRQPMQQIGEVATRLLIESIDKPSIKRQDVLLKGELVYRESHGRRR